VLGCRTTSAICHLPSAICRLPHAMSLCIVLHRRRGDFCLEPHVCQMVLDELLPYHALIFPMPVKQHSWNSNRTDHATPIAIAVAITFANVITTSTPSPRGRGDRNSTIGPDRRSSLPLSCTRGCSLGTRIVLVSADRARVQPNRRNGDLLTGTAFATEEARGARKDDGVEQSWQPAGRFQLRLHRDGRRFRRNRRGWGIRRKRVVRVIPLTTNRTSPPFWPPRGR
jgi:hypothetical protein